MSPPGQQSGHDAASPALEPSGLRDLMPALAGKAYFNYGGQGPLPTPSLEAIQHSWVRIQELGPFGGAVWPFVKGTVAGLRAQLAASCGVSPQRLSFTENVTSGCLLPLWGLPWEAGDALLISDAEHPGVVAGCRELAHRHDLTTANLPVAAERATEAEAAAAVLEALERTLTPRTRLVVLSHLLWNTGQTMPIAAVAARLAAHPRQPWLLVDGAQSLGSLPVAEAAAAADIYACTGHKWCCGPEGLGVAVLSERVLQQSRPTLIGWRSLRQEGESESAFHSDGRRFEVATSCTPLFAGLHTSLNLLKAVGSPEARLVLIRQRAEQLWGALQEVAGVRTVLNTPPPAGLVSFHVEGQEPAALVQRLAERGFWLRNLPEPSCLRACTHVTTSASEVQALVEAIAACAGG